MQISAINNYSNNQVYTLPKQNFKGGINSKLFKYSYGNSQANRNFGKTLRKIFFAALAFLAVSCNKQTEQPEPPNNNYEYPSDYVDPLYITDQDAGNEFFEWYNANCPECLKPGYTGEIPENIDQIAAKWAKDIANWWFTYNANHQNGGDGNDGENP